LGGMAGAQTDSTIVRHQLQCSLDNCHTFSTSRGDRTEPPRALQVYPGLAPETSFLSEIAAIN
jgi:hypothetical protein